ncbi:MAG: DUF1549 domain-containing protein [Gemmataceae bacterium]
MAALVRCALLACCFTAWWQTHACGQNDAPSDPLKAKPVAVWRFDGGSEPGVTANTPREAGPRPPVFPSFSATNQAFACVGSANGFRVAEKDMPEANLRFVQGDSITLEAWVKVQELRDGTYAYLIGKGRTRSAGFPEKNQNYALRLFGKKGEAAITFLFASQPEAGKPSDWHRWTSTKTFDVNGRWSHVAVTYTFGKPKSIRGYIHGQETVGVWDMGGETERPPVADADDLMIGTGNGGGPGNTFRGWIDEVAIWRLTVPGSELSTRYQPVTPPPVVRREALPKGEVLVQICEGLPDRNGWPDISPEPNETYHERAFGLFEVPHLYVDTGVRGDRKAPFLVRAAAEVNLPPGKHRLLLRGRGASRLTFDGKTLLSTPFPPADKGGHGTVLDPRKYLDLGPDFRFVPPGNREATTTFVSQGKPIVVVLETIVGGSKRRPELGETVIAVCPEGETTWRLLTPGDRILPYTDQDWTAYQTERQAALDVRNAQRRAECRAKHEAFLAMRRNAAREWLAKTPETAVPALPKSYPAHNAIDHFLADRMRKVAAEAKQQAGSIDFHERILPILHAKCFDCHAGDKVKGKLKLDDRASAIRGGKSDGAAIAPGHPEKSSLIARILSPDDRERMPPQGKPLDAEQVKLLQAWIREGAAWPEYRAEKLDLTPLTDDLAFLRRVTLDVVGVVPTAEEAKAFLAATDPNKRAKLIDRLLADPRWADHWMGYWQDVLAENPNILNPTLNNTGPFRWWLHESFLDNKPMDLFVIELLRMRGSERFGGPAGFAVASQNDA